MSVPGKPWLSIIIATRNRERTLLPCLRSVAHLNTLDGEKEIILINDGVQFSQTLKAVASEMSAKVVHSKSRLGLTAARNLGVKLAVGNVCAFIDDDVEVHPMWLESLRKDYFQRNSDAVCGRITTKSLNDPPSERLPVGCIGLNGHQYLNYTSSKFWFVEKMPGCNMSFRKSILQEIGGFDENFGEHCYADDLEVSLRLIKRGFKILYDPQAVVWHKEVPEGGTRAEPHVYALYGIRNATYVYLKLCESPKKFSAIIRSNFGVTTMCLKRDLRKSRERHIFRILSCAMKGFVSGGILLLQERRNAKTRRFRSG